MHQISVIVTVKNEGEAVRPLLESLLEQTCPPYEVVVCDGGSTDDTLAVLEEYTPFLPLKIILSPGANISQGRNRAIEAATGDIIAATDAGVSLSATWIEELTRPIQEGRTAVTSGWFESDPYTDFEVIMGSTVLPARRDIKPKHFLPSSRSIAFRKEAWAEVGGYPEWLDYSEDLVFDFALREKFGPFAFAPNAIAYFRPRGSFRAFFRQYYLYARGDGKANLWAKRHAIRYLTYFVAMPVIIWLIWREKLSGLLLMLAGLAAYGRRPAQRLWRNTWGWSLQQRLQGLALIPIIRFVGDVAKMIGYPVGLWWRWRNRANLPK